MRMFKSLMGECPRNERCWEWAWMYMEYCICSVKDGVSLGLGMLSVIIWVVAEIPQIITNFKEKSTEGLSATFLTMWILGDIFNLFGCILEPATLPTQYYLAILYTLITVILGLQSIYYSHIYPRLNYNKRSCKGLKPIQTKATEKTGQNINDVGKLVNSTDRWKIGQDTFDSENVSSSPIPLPALPQNISPGKELYYTSARSLSRSHTPTKGSILAQRTSPTSFHTGISIYEPLLPGHDSTLAARSPKTKTMLCLVSVMILIGTFNLHHPAYYENNRVFEKSSKVFSLQVGRKLLQVKSGPLQVNHTEASNGIGTNLGWAMAVIYMGGRFPQIFLNIRRGKIEGLNPLMFFFALVGNATYVASILVSSLDWSKISPNLPWLVDAGGCVLLDTLVSLLNTIRMSFSNKFDYWSKWGFCFLNFESMFTGPTNSSAYDFPISHWYIKLHLSPRLLVTPPSTQENCFSAYVEP